jgi:hypothetical protein
MKIPICLMMLAGAVVAGELDKNFETPPPAARPWCYQPPFSPPPDRSPTLSPAFIPKANS